MSITLTEGRAVLTGNVLHTGTSTFSTSKQDRAIRDACNEFIAATNCNRTTATISISSGTREFDPTASVTGFREDFYLDESTIAWDDVKLTTSKSIARKYAGSVAGKKLTGRPTEIGFRGPAEAWLWPEADATYSLEFAYREQLNTWTIGTASPGSVTLNIPTEWVGPIIHLGAKYYLLYGAAEAHPDSIGIWEKWQRTLDRAETRFRPTTSGLNDRNAVPNSRSK